MKKLQIRTLANRMGGTPSADVKDYYDTGGGGGPCAISNCQTTCLFRVECCCWYQCPSGGTWVCKTGYCSNTSSSCL